MHALTKETCMATVQRDGLDLEFVPENLKTFLVCLAAVRQNGNALKFVPEDMRTPHVSLIALSHGVSAYTTPVRQMRWVDPDDYR